MKKKLVAAVLFWAPAIFAGSCVPGTLQSYINLGAAGCQDGSVTFAAFTTAPGQTGATPIAPGQITVTPGGTLLMPTLQFSDSVTATDSALLESFFRFSVTGGTFTGTGISLLGSVTGGGSLTAIENVCPGASFVGNSPSGCPNPAGSPLAVIVTGFATNSDSTTFAGRSSLDVFVDITADGTGGSASLQSATLSVTGAASNAVPEPATAGMLLIGSALLILGRKTVRGKRLTRRDHEAI